MADTSPERGNPRVRRVEFGKVQGSAPLLHVEGLLNKTTGRRKVLMSRINAL